jgi:hypothetical protein
VLVFAAFEAPAVVPGFDDVAVMSGAMEQRGRHLGVREDARPFAERQIGGYEAISRILEALIDSSDKAFALQRYKSSIKETTKAGGLGRNG